MRKTAAALAAATLSLSLLAAPTTAGAQPVDDVEKVSCGTVGPPLCAPLGQVVDALAPLAPVFDLAGPLFSEVGRTVESLSQLGLSAEGVPAADLEAAAAAALAQLDALPEPLAGLVEGSGQGEALRSALTALLDALAATPVGEALAPLAPAEEPEPAPGPSPSSGPGSSAPAPSRVGSTSASASTGFGGSLSSGAPASPQTASRVPAVPVGSTLVLGSLAMPQFGLSPIEQVGSAAAAVTAERIAKDLVLPAADAAAALDQIPDDSGALTTIAVVSLLLVAAGVALDRRRKTHHVIHG